MFSLSRTKPAVWPRLMRRVAVMNGMFMPSPTKSTTFRAARARGGATTVQTAVRGGAVLEHVDPLPGAEQHTTALDGYR